MSLSYSAALTVVASTQSIDVVPWFSTVPWIKSATYWRKIELADHAISSAPSGRARCQHRTVITSIAIPGHDAHDRPALTIRSDELPADVVVPIPRLHHTIGASGHQRGRESSQPAAGVKRRMRTGLMRHPRRRTVRARPTTLRRQIHATRTPDSRYGFNSCSTSGSSRVPTRMAPKSLGPITPSGENRRFNTRDAWIRQACLTGSGTADQPHTPVISTRLPRV